MYFIDTNVMVHLITKVNDVMYKFNPRLIMTLLKCYW